jgi:AcrR family transcriptional regulator
VGWRGARTRQQILDAALRCFEEKGFHSTAVDDIATGAEVSRATLYQYFASKEAIFVELMHEAGSALIRVTRRLGPLGPTAEGYDNLHWWLGEWTWVFDRYSSMFIEWANVNSPRAPLRPQLAQFVDFHTERFDSVIEAAGVPSDGRSAASILTLAVANRFNYIRHVYRPAIAEQQMLDSLATSLQLFLFPDTSLAVLNDGPRSLSHAIHSGHPPVHAARPLIASLPRRGAIGRAGPFDGVSGKATPTVRQLLDAAGRVFAAHGYDATNIDLIVTEAGVARGTFYRYFSDKLELMTALARETSSVMCPMFAEFAVIAPARDAEALRQWLWRFLVAQRRYSGVLRAWTEGFPIDPMLLGPAADVVAAMTSAVTAAFGPPRPYPLDGRAAVMLVAALLEHFPHEGAGSRYEPSDDDIVEAQAHFVERAILAPLNS